MSKIDASQQNIRNMSEGIIQSVDESILPQNSVYLSVNFLFDKYLGRAQVRPGSTLFNSQIQSGKSCLGLYQFRKADGSVEELAVFNNSGDTNSVLKYDNGGTWANAVTNLTASLKVHFETFLGTVVALNGTEKRSSTDGITWVSTGGNLDLGNMPAGKYVREFKDRLYVAGVSSALDRVYFSSLPSAGAISWTSGNGYIDIEPEDGGGGIIGLAKVPGYILFFKRYSMKRWDGQSAYPDSMINIGAPSQEAIVEARQSVFFYNPKGIYETNGGYPRKISRKVQDIIEAISSSYYTSVSGICDDDYVLFSIGDITIDGLSLTNCVLAYHIDNQQWTLLSFPNEFKMWAKMTDSSTPKIIAGDDNGNVWKVLQGTGDGSTSVKYILQTQPKELSSRSRIKEITKLIAHVRQLRSATVFVRIDNDGVTEFNDLDVIDKDVTEIDRNIKGRIFEFRIMGESNVGQVIGLDFADVDITENTYE